MCGDCKTWVTMRFQEDDFVTMTEIAINRLVRWYIGLSIKLMCAKHEEM